MLLPIVIVGGGSLLALSLSQSGEGEAGAAPPLQVAPEGPTPGQEGAPSDGAGGFGLGNVKGLVNQAKSLKSAISGGGAAAKAATIGAGLVALELQGKLVELTGRNQESGNVSRTFGPPATLGFLADAGAKKAAELLGADARSGVVKGLGQVAGLGVAGATVLGAGAFVPVLTGKLVGEGASALLGAIAGKKAEQSARNAVSQLDPTKSGSLASNVTNAIGSGVSAAAGLLTGGLLGPSAPPPPPTPAQVAAGAAALSKITAGGKASYLLPSFLK